MSIQVDNGQMKVFNDKGNLTHIADLVEEASMQIATDETGTRFDVYNAQGFREVSVTHEAGTKVWMITDQQQRISIN